LPRRDHGNTGHEASPDFTAMFPSNGSSLAYAPSSHGSNSLAYAPSSHGGNSPVYSPGNYGGNTLAGPGNQTLAVASPSLALSREPTLIDIDYYNGNTPAGPGNQILAIAIPSPALTREPTPMDTDYYTASPGPFPPPLPLSTSHYNIRGHILFPRHRPSIIANWPPEVLEIMNRNVLSSN
jgi:hypothetical protein